MFQFNLKKNIKYIYRIYAIIYLDSHIFIIEKLIGFGNNVRHESLINKSLPRTKSSSGNLACTG